MAALPVFAWVYPEHRDIAVVGVSTLDPKRAEQFQALWLEARAGHETRLCELAADAQQGVTPLCIDWAALPAIAGDHSCSSDQMLQTVLKADWILTVADIAAQLKVDLSRVPVVPTADQLGEDERTRGILFPDVRRRIQDETIRADRLNALRSSDIRLQRADPAYATRAGANNAHFLTARPTTTINPTAYGEATIGPGHELNAVGIYSWFHLSALEKAMQLAREKLTPAQRAALVRGMLADEAFALHFLQDTYAAGHIAGTWGDASERKGTHDFYNANGIEVRTWDDTDRSVVLMGDAHMRPEDAQLAGRAVRASLEQLLDVVNGRPVAGLQLPAAGDTKADALDVCKTLVFPPRREGHELTRQVGPVLAETLMPTPVPSLGPGLGSMPRFRSEVGPFMGLAAGIEARGVSGGFAPGQTDDGVIYGLDIGFRAGLGLEGVMGDSGDGLIFAQIGLHSDGASSNRAANQGASAGGGLLAAIPSRTGVSARFRMPFYLIPGDLLFTAPLYFLAPETYSTMAVTASNGGLIPWQLGMSTSIGRFQFVIGRELGLTWYGATGDDSLVAPGPPSMILDYKSISYDLPILEYRPYRSFARNQSSTVLFQLFAGIDVPYSYVPTVDYGFPAPKLSPVYSLGLRMLFDWRYYH